MGARLTTFGIWAAVLACAVAWALPLFTRGTPVPAGASVAVPAPPPGGSLARLLGEPPAAPVAEAPVVVPASRFQLVGVVAPRQAGHSGLALIAVDGKPARPVGVGREVEPGLKLLSVAHRQVQLGASTGAPTVTLNLAPLPEAQRGRPDSLPPAGAPMAAVPPGGVPGLPPVQGVAPNAVMRVPPMPGMLPPMLQQPRNQPGAAVPQPVPRPGGLGDGASLPYQADGSQDAGVQPGGGQPGSLR